MASGVKKECGGNMFFSRRRGRNTSQKRKKDWRGRNVEERSGSPNSPERKKAD